MTIFDKAELAKYLKLHEVTIQKMAIEGTIPAFKIGKEWRFSKEEIDNWLKKEHSVNCFDKEEFAKFLKKFKKNYE